MSLEEYIPLEVELQQVLTPEQAWHYQIVPKQFDDEEMTFYGDEAHVDDIIIEELEVLFGKDIRIEHRQPGVIQKTLGKFYRRSGSNSQSVEVGSNHTDDFLSNLIVEAKGLNSSDIHIEVYEDNARVRIRIDGMLVERYRLGRQDYPALVNKIKIKAHLDIAEKRLPQDGRISFDQDGVKVDIRVSILPTLHGEKVVLRLLSNDATNIDIAKLGFSEEELEDYLMGVRQPNGIVLISGPTGSGKTTTLYATLKILNEEKRNIMTVEDPIEYTLEGINQVQLKESIGLTFASALRTFLRQDPDIIMLGEIRDGETAQMAIRAALTGHLVLSTIHTNSAWGTVSRLIDMDVPPFLLASTLNSTVAQRLLRQLCPACKAEKPLERSEYPKTYRPLRELTTQWVPVGCEECFYTGYRGRKAIYEVIPIDFELSDRIKNSELNIDELMSQRKIRKLTENAFEVFAAGQTSLEEIYPLLLNYY